MEIYISVTLLVEAEQAKVFLYGLTTINILVILLMGVELARVLIRGGVEVLTKETSSMEI